MTARLSKELFQKLSDIVGDKYITSEPLATFVYTQDASVFGGTDARIIIRPGSTEEVSQILSLANQRRIPVVIRGGGASIYGQPKGVPKKNILLDMTRMNKVLEMNPESMTVTAQCGIIMGKLQHPCRQAGFYLFCPFAPLQIVSLGGWISGAAGGGGIWRDIVSLTVVLPDGTVVKTGGGPGSNVRQKLSYNRVLGGPDFTGLFIGDGGSFGVKTEATVRLTRFPEVIRASIFEFCKLEKVLEVIKRHVACVDPHPFNPIMVFGSGAMRNFMPDLGEGDAFVVMGMMQGHSAQEMDAKLDTFNALGEALDGQRNPALDAMAATMAASSSSESETMMDWLSFFNALGLACWLPFTLPREGFAENYCKLIAWRQKRLEEAERRAFRWNGTFEFFTPSDQSTIIGEIDVFFQNTSTPEMFAFVRTTMQQFQEYSHELGSIDVYNQGVMSYINGRFWSPGFRQLFQTVKSALDPNLILNPDLWMSEQKDTKRK